jgi:adenylate kinase family enzyme
LEIRLKFRGVVFLAFLLKTCRILLRKEAFLKHAILPVGPQYAGKSTFCKGIVSAHPEVVYVSRDEILVEMFGSVWLSEYTGKHLLGLDRMWSIVSGQLRKNDVTIILDTWNSHVSDRMNIVGKLRSLGADTVTAWRFITPEATCFRWFLKRAPFKPGSSEKWTKLRLKARRHDSRRVYQFFHSQPLGDKLFDEVVEINPLEPRLLDPLLLQAQPA